MNLSNQLNKFILKNTERAIGFSQNLYNLLYKLSILTLQALDHINKKSTTSTMTCSIFDT